MRRRAGILLWRNPLLQAALLLGAWWVCERLVHGFGLPVPGSILALALLLCLLLGGQVRLGSVRRGANGLLDHMVLFFVPAVMALMNHRDLLGLVGLKILGVILASTLVVMVGTALVVEACWRWKTDAAQ